MQSGVNSTVPRNGGSDADVQPSDILLGVSNIAGSIFNSARSTSSLKDEPHPDNFAPAPEQNTRGQVRGPADGRPARVPQAASPPHVLAPATRLGTTPEFGITRSHVAADHAAATSAEQRSGLFASRSTTTKGAGAVLAEADGRRRWRFKIFTIVTTSLALGATAGAVLLAISSGNQAAPVHPQPVSPPPTTSALTHEPPLLPPSSPPPFAPLAFATTSVVSLGLTDVGAATASDLLSYLTSAAVGGSTTGTSETVEVVVNVKTTIAITVPDGKTPQDVVNALSKEICGDPPENGCTVEISARRRLRMPSRRSLAATSFTVKKEVDTTESAIIAPLTVDDTALSSTLGSTVTATVDPSTVEAEVTVTKEGSAGSDVATSTVNTMDGMGASLATSLGVDPTAVTTLVAPKVIAPPNPPPSSPPPSPPTLPPLAAEGGGDGGGGDGGGGDDGDAPDEIDASPPSGDGAGAPLGAIIGGAVAVLVVGTALFVLRRRALTKAPGSLPEFCDSRSAQLRRGGTKSLPLPPELPPPLPSGSQASVPLASTMPLAESTLPSMSAVVDDSLSRDSVSAELGLRGAGALEEASLKDIMISGRSSSVDKVTASLSTKKPVDARQSHASDPVPRLSRV